MMFHHVSSAWLADSWLASWPTWGPAVLAMHAMRRPTRLARSLALSLPNTFLLPLTLPPPEPAQHCLQLLQLSRSATWVLITRLLFPTSPLLLRYYKNTRWWWLQGDAYWGRNKLAFPHDFRKLVRVNIFKLYQSGDAYLCFLKWSHRSSQ